MQLVHPSCQKFPTGQSDPDEIMEVIMHGGPALMYLVELTKALDTEQNSNDPDAQ